MTIWSMFSHSEGWLPQHNYILAKAYTNMVRKFIEFNRYLLNRILFCCIDLAKQIVSSLKIVLGLNSKTIWCDKFVRD